MKYYIVKVGSDYIAEGRNYTVQGESFVPLTGRRCDAKRYRTRKLAEKATQRSGENILSYETVVIEVEE